MKKSFTPVKKDALPKVLKNINILIAISAFFFVTSIFFAYVKPVTQWGMVALFSFLISMVIYCSELIYGHVNGYQILRPHLPDTRGRIFRKYKETKYSNFNSLFDVFYIVFLCTVIVVILYLSLQYLLLGVRWGN